MSGLDKYILKELDRQRIDSNSISIIFRKLENVEKKNKFLNYLVGKRNVLLQPNEIIKYVCKEL